MNLHLSSFLFEVVQCKDSKKEAEQHLIFSVGFFSESLGVL